MEPVKTREEWLNRLAANKMVAVTCPGCGREHGEPLNCLSQDNYCGQCYLAVQHAKVDIEFNLLGTRRGLYSELDEKALRDLRAKHGNIIMHLALEDIRIEQECAIARQQEEDSRLILVTFDEIKGELRGSVCDDLDEIQVVVTAAVRIGGFRDNVVKVLEGLIEKIKAGDHRFSVLDEMRMQPERTAGNRK